MKHAIDPTSYDRPVEGAGAETKRALAELRDALKTGDPEQIRKALQNLRDAMAKYNGTATDAADNIGKRDPRKKNLMDAALGNFKAVEKDVGSLQSRPNDHAKIEEVMDSVGDALNEVLDVQRNNEKDDAIKASALTNNLLASLGSLGDDDMDLGDLLGQAGLLSDLMRGLVGDSTKVARALATNPEALTPAAKAALDLDRLLARLEGKELAPLAPVTTTVQELPPVALSGPIAKDSHFQPIDLKTATSFEDVAAAIAYEIHQKAKALSSEGDAIAVELANLSRAARAGDRQTLLMSAKAAAAHILAFCKKLIELAHSIPCRNERERREQDRLLKTAASLKDTATQLKILAAVKAATIEDSRDTDATLTTLTRNLGVLINQGLDAMQVTHLTIKGRK